MNSLSIFDEMIDRHGEHLEMIEADDASVAMIQILCNMLAKEREEKETYKKMYQSHRCQTQGINS